MHAKLFSMMVVAIILFMTAVSPIFSDEVPDPETFFGHKPGADYKLIRWEKMLEYFSLLAESSDRILVQNLGKTTLGNPFILTVISAPDNLARLDRYKEIARKLAGGRISEDEAQDLSEEGKTIALVTCSMHASECGPTQMSPELSYVLATDNSAQIRAILDDVIFLLVPSWNPDGNILTTDWYRRNVGTDFERAPMPWLYHHYVGHDNNRDAFMHNLVETKFVNDILYHEWYPQIFMDMHHMGNSSARLFLSPLYDPRHHSLDPLLTREIELTGAYMRTVLEEQGKIAVMHYALWNHWRMSAIHTCALWHNVPTILFEAAGTSMATPIYQKPDDLDSPDRGRLGTQGNGQTINYPSPWPGGWWRLRDIVEYAYWSVIGFLESGAKHRDKYLMNMYRMASNSVKRGKTEPPYAYIIPGNQKDPNTVVKMVNILLSGGLEVHQATKPFQTQGQTYEAGTYVALMSQPYRPYLIDILGPQIYPDRRLYKGGPPESTFDLTGWTLPYLMGVEVVKVDSSFAARLKPVHRAQAPPGEVSGGGNSYILDHNVLDSYRAVNRLIREGFSVSWAKKPFVSAGKKYPAGAIIVSGAGVSEKVQILASEFNLQFVAGLSPRDTLPLKALRLGLYKPWVANKDEGWTRFIFDSWEFPYTTVHDAEIRSGRLKDRYDVIVLTNVSASRIINGHKKGRVPPEYTGGIGKDGLTALRRFVRDGGTLIALNASCQLLVDQFKIPLRDVSRSFPSNEFFCPSAILKVDLDISHPITYGMRETAAILSYGSPLYEPIPGDQDASDGKKPVLPSGYNVVAAYPDSNPFKSGRLIGEKILRNKPVLIETEYGRGRLIIFGFRPQNRAQTHGTFMLFFNALYYGQALTD